MFEAFLSCRLIGIPETTARSGYITVAQMWSGNRKLVPETNGDVYWDDKADIGIRMDVPGQYAWFDSPPPAIVRVHHALIALDKSQGLYAFVSPISGITTAFRKWLPPSLHVAMDHVSPIIFQSAYWVRPRSRQIYVSNGSDQRTGQRWLSARHHTRPG